MLKSLYALRRSGFIFLFHRLCQAQISVTSDLAKECISENSLQESYKADKSKTSVCAGHN